jgi:hypothetical protein
MPAGPLEGGWEGGSVPGVDLGVVDLECGWNCGLSDPCAVPSCTLCFVECLGSMTCSAEPLQVGECMVVVVVDVVALIAYAVALGCVGGGLALALCSCLDLGPACWPVRW